MKTSFIAFVAIFLIATAVAAPCGSCEGSLSSDGNKRDEVEPFAGIKREEVEPLAGI